jgi:hypothetical protein
MLARLAGGANAIGRAGSRAYDFSDIGPFADIGREPARINEA